MEYFYGYPQPQQWIRTSEEEEKAKECVWANRGKARTNTHARTWITCAQRQGRRQQ